VTYDYIRHYHTDTICDMYRQCLLTAYLKFRCTFNKIFFYKRIPKFVKLRRHQDGLCSLHHTRVCMEAELDQKRKLWHENCTCTCAYCSADGCNHEKSSDRGLCSQFLCHHCHNVKCSLDWNNTGTSWSRPTRVKHKKGGLYSLIRSTLANNQILWNLV
jgi:hypothetical protein